MTYLSAILADSPTVVWPLDETSGTVAADASGNGNDGTYYGSPTLDDTTLWTGNNCPTFAVDDYVEIDTPVSLGRTWTIEAWAVRAASTISGFYAAVVAGDTPGSGLSCRLCQTVGDTLSDPDGRYAVMGQGAIEFEGNTSLYAPLDGADARDTVLYSPFDVHHYVLVMDNTAKTFTLYYDGFEVDSESISPQSAQDFALFTLRVARDSGTSGHWVGGIGWVALYPSALSAERVLAHFLASGAPIVVDDNFTFGDDAFVTIPLDDSDTATATDLAGLTVDLSDADTGTATDAGALTVEFSGTDSAVASDLFAGGRVDPNISVSDIAYASERAVMTSNAAGAWPFDAPYDADVRSVTYDFRDARVTLTETSDDIFDADIHYTPGDFAIA